MQPRRRNEKKLSCLQNSLSFLWVSSSGTSLSRYFTAVKPKIPGAFTCSQTMLRVHQEGQPLPAVPRDQAVPALPLAVYIAEPEPEHSGLNPFKHHGQRQQHWAFTPSSHSVSLTVLSPPGPDSNLCSRYITATYLGKKSLLCFFQALMQIWPQEYVRHL